MAEDSIAERLQSWLFKKGDKRDLAKDAIKGAAAAGGGLVVGIVGIEVIKAIEGLSKTDSQKKAIDELNKLLSDPNQSENLVKHLQVGANGSNIRVSPKSYSTDVGETMIVAKLKPDDKLDLPILVVTGQSPENPANDTLHGNWYFIPTIDQRTGKVVDGGFAYSGNFAEQSK